MSNLEIRRVITGHDENGKAIIQTDDVLKGKEIGDGAGAFALVWSTDIFPSDNTDEFDGSKREIKRVSPGGSVLQIVTMKPGTSSAMHRTRTLDYGIVLEGEVELELDEGVTATVKAGEVVIQRGTIHAWHNRAEKESKVAFILLDAQELKVGEKLLQPIG